MTVEKKSQYRVLVNNETQYSIWPVYKPLPIGWIETSYKGEKADCLAYIDRVWNDMREASFQHHLAHSAALPQSEQSL
ncbi:MAG: MbtH family NRPS accessory protein [Pseudomonadota bacterium]